MIYIVSNFASLFPLSFDTFDHMEVCPCLLLNPVNCRNAMVLET